MRGLSYLSEKSAYSLSQLVHMQGKARLEVSSLVGMDDVGLSQLVKHLLHQWQQLLGLSLVGSGAELAHCIAHSLCIVAVVLGASLGLTQSL